MCDFFSCVSDGKGKVMYFDWGYRKKFLDGELDIESPDSHTSIADFYGYKGAKEDTLNKYEFNPLTDVFRVDQAYTKDDIGEVARFCRSLDFKEIVPALIVKPIFHPFRQKNRKKVTEKDLALLKEWDSVRASVRASVWASMWDSVRDSVGASVWDSVRASVWDSVWDSVRASVWDSVRDSVRDSVWDSVRASVGDSVWAYIGSFFSLPKWKYIEHKKGVYPFQPAVDLWERGLVPSYDGKTWRLHGGHEGKVLWEGDPR